LPTFRYTPIVNPSSTRRLVSSQSVAGTHSQAVFGDGEAPHCLGLFGEPVKKLVEFTFVQRLGVACGERRQCQYSCEQYFAFHSCAPLVPTVCAFALRKVLFVFQNISRLTLQGFASRL